MQIWHMECYPIGDRRLPHHLFPPKLITPDQLTQLAGVVYYKVDLDDSAATKKRISRVRSERGVAYSDVLTIDESLGDLSQTLEELYEPVENKDDTVCMVLEGSMYCDVEVEEDEWIRIQLERGDLIVVPKGRPFRYTTTPKNFVRLQRFARRGDEMQG
ncbi:hypothetical protein M3Y94_01153800 [Aphelenchoides besseyi]|nr:hypothetical protein M3Y94_01153800 [Aphelenchoides besseyi]KAI6227992.1 1,2-dihydroxy-3-keto-5-methylthiopentene dioxygenase-like protein [Aphelenchoides besseyi]